VAFGPLQLGVDLVGALGEQEEAATEEDEVAAGDGVETACENASTVNSGSVSRITQESEKSSRMRVIIASPRPMVRAFGCCSLGSLPERMEMKITLSMPRTTSSTVKVSRPIQIWGSEIHSIAGLPPALPRRRADHAPSEGRSAIR
jgi:hypothetical protein